MKFKAKPVKVEQDNDLDMRSKLHHHLPDNDSDLELTKLPSPIRSADEDSGVGGSPGSSSRLTHNCNMCNKKFSRADILRKHMKTHVSTSCTVCGQQFNDKVALAKHQVEVHTLDRVFQCSQCDKGFKEMRTLRLHLKIHNAEYPEQCGVCQKVFRTKWQLKQHQMDHGGERPYPCPECSFTCKTKQQLNEHRRKHSGEKAYSCAQCGTRFTYRNGLIKHTKLNRCPKKIITPEGETIIKKRSRTFQQQNKKEPASSGPDPSPTPPAQPQPATPTRDLDQQQANATLFVQNNQIQLHANGGTYGLALLEDGSLIATPATQHGTPAQAPTHYEQKLGSSSLSPNVIAALSAATGLSPQDIGSWAAHLPVGSTVKVTHHNYDSSPPAPKMVKQTNLSLDHVLRPQAPRLTLDMASACHDSLISACVGLPSYQESFAVDPNEILSKDRGTKALPSSYAYGRDDLNNNQGVDFLDTEPVDGKIHTANSRLLNTMEQVKQEPRQVQNNGFLADLDLEFPDHIMDDMDIAGFTLNDQDFTSIRSIVEQAFKDGRDVLDIISAV